MATWTYFHDLDPFIIHFTGNFGLRWYSMAYIMGFLSAYFIISRLIYKKITLLSKQDVTDLIVWAAFGVILGGRLGYALFYDQDLLTKFDSYFPYWEFLKIYHGGLASHGGIIGLIVATALFAKRRGFSTWHCLDLTVLGGMGIFFGRIANFINGELFGRVIEGKTLLAVQFPQEMLLWVSQKKVGYLQDLDKAVSVLKSGVSADIWRNWIYQFESTGEYRRQIYSHIYSLVKACEDGNREVIQALKEVISYRHPSQIYQAFLEGLFPFLVAWFLFNRKKPLKPGVIGGIWALSYGVMRVLGEQFRMPDAPLGFSSFGPDTRTMVKCIYVNMYYWIFFPGFQNSKNQQTIKLRMSFRKLISGYTRVGTKNLQ